jgi:hypothetical protein
MSPARRHPQGGVFGAVVKACRPTVPRPPRSAGRRGRVWSSGAGSPLASPFGQHPLTGNAALADTPLAELVAAAGDACGARPGRSEVAVEQAWLYSSSRTRWDRTSRTVGPAPGRPLPLGLVEPGEGQAAPLPIKYAERTAGQCRRIHDMPSAASGLDRQASQSLGRAAEESSGLGGVAKRPFGSPAGSSMQTTSMADVVVSQHNSVLMYNYTVWSSVRLSGKRRHGRCPAF